MYIEVFLLDNFIFNMIIIKIAAAISLLSYSRFWAVTVSVLQALYAAFAVNIPLMRCFFAKIALCFLCSAPFCIAQRKFTLLPMPFVFLSTIISGGFVYALALKSGGQLSHDCFRLILYPAFLLSLFPSLLRHIHRLKIKSKLFVRLEFLYDGQKYEFPAMYDSGNTLCEPLSGLPVILVYAPELMQFAHIPIICSDVGSSGRMIYAFKAEQVTIGDYSSDVLIAPTDANPGMKALIPFTILNPVEKI